MKQLTSRQASILIFIATCAFKMLALPSMIISRAQNNAWIVILTMFVIDACFFAIMLVIMKKYPDLQFKDFLEKGLGKVIAKVVLILIGILICFKVALQIRECYEFYNETSYVNFKMIAFLLPMFLILLYVGMMELRALGRTGEIVIYFVVIAIAVSILLSITYIDLPSILPVLKKGINPIFSSCLDYSFWFGDFIILYFFMGNIKKEKKMYGKMFFSYVIAMVIVLALVIVHYSVFGSISSSFITSVIDVTEYIPRAATGRFTWVIVVLWPITMLISIFLYYNFSVKCFVNTFGTAQKSRKIIIFVVVAIILAILIITTFSLNLFIYYFQNGLKYFVVFVQYFIPIIFPIASVSAIRRKKQYENIS